jgi:hypothetical protein
MRRDSDIEHNVPRDNQDENVGVVSRRKGVARLERYHPRVSPEVGGSDGRDRLGY